MSLSFSIAQENEKTNHIPLERSFYERNTQVVAFELIGKILVLKENGMTLSGKIVETEAYFGTQDPASHAYRGVTPRNQVMFGAPGISYVYFTYGSHHCLNVVTEKEDVAGAVLIRSLEPIDGVAIMRKRRGNVNEEQLTNGPGKLTQAFGITREHSGIDLTSGSFCPPAQKIHGLSMDECTMSSASARCRPGRDAQDGPRRSPKGGGGFQGLVGLYITEGHEDDFLSIKAAKRIGISQAKDELFRFYLTTSAFVSVRC